jgi:hypothetical protein
MVYQCRGQPSWNDVVTKQKGRQKNGAHVTGAEGHNASGNKAQMDHLAAVVSTGRTGSGSALGWTVGILEWVETTGACK